MPAYLSRVAFVALAFTTLAVATAEATPTPEQVAFFETKIRPVLSQHCYQCHSAEALKTGKLKAGLLVDTRAGMMKGGESGAAVVPGKKTESLLLAALKHESFEMPPAGKLPDAVISDFEKWIDMGAPDPRDDPVATVDERTIDVEAGRKHWSYRRLAPVSPPEVRNASWPRNDIDRFLLAKQEAAGVTPAPEAAKGTLARRLFYDLTGLPPTPEELKQVLDDASPDAYEKLVDRLLASPRFGERWARHWLDTVRFGESGGYEFDGDRPGAHFYRDWVIKAFNADLPYDEFLRLQVAGDLIKPGDLDATSATGFLVAGPYPGQVTAKTVEPIRYDQLDDMVQTLGSSVLGMTIGCARCHDHKFDPIGHRDYYAMIACLGKAVQRATDIDPDPATTKRKRDAWQAEKSPIAAAMDRFRREELIGSIGRWLATSAAAQQSAGWIALDPQTVKAAKATLAEDTDDVVSASGRLEGDDVYTLTFRTHAKGLRGIRLEALASPSSAGAAAGPGTGKDGSFRLSTMKVTAAPVVPAAGRVAVTPKLSAVATTFEDSGFELAKALDADVNTGWSTTTQPGKPQAAVIAFDTAVGFDGGTLLTVELKFESKQHGLARLRVAAATDPAAAGVGGAATPQAAREVAAVLDAARAAGRDPVNGPDAVELLRWFSRLDAEAARLQSSLDAINAKEPKPNLLNVYATTNGPWVITGNGQGVASGSQDVFVLARGEVNRKKGKAATGFVLATVDSDAAEAKLLSTPDGKPVADGRIGLANFLTDVPSGSGPLAARVIVNRLWHHHFGRGIVTTPNDFGTQGDKPTHPELLEWLANRLVEGRWSLKAIHRLIVTSAAYRQDGTTTAANLEKDPDNTLLWQRRPRRLEGEAIRDALLAASGRLDTTMYGRAGLDLNSPRRSIYLTVRRSDPIGFLSAFDQPEPVQSVGARGVATVPTQALAMMNAPFVRAAAQGLATRAIQAAGAGQPAAATAGKDAEAVAADLIDRCFLAAVSRQPTPAERERFVRFLMSREQAGGGSVPASSVPASSVPASSVPASSPAARQAAVADVCRLVFCLNEFVYVD